MGGRSSRLSERRAHRPGLGLGGGDAFVRQSRASFSLALPFGLLCAIVLNLADRRRKEGAAGRDSSLVSSLCLIAASDQRDGVSFSGLGPFSSYSLIVLISKA